MYALTVTARAKLVRVQRIHRGVETRGKHLHERGAAEKGSTNQTKKEKTNRPAGKGLMNEPRTVWLASSCLRRHRF